MGGGFSATWREDFDDWRRSVDDFFGGQAATPVRVLVWGPGEHDGAYKKRAKIADHLNRVNAHNEASTGEELIQRDPRLKSLPLHRAEEVLAGLADLVICLSVEEPRAPGVLGEILLFGTDDDLRAKIRHLKPADSKPLGFVARVADELLPDSQCFPYTAEQLNLCVDIRARCEAWVDAVRAAKYRRLRREHA